MRHDPAGRPLLSRSRLAVRSRYFLAAASGLAVVLAAGCSSPSGPGGPVSSTVTITVVPGIDDAPIYLAQKDGLFAAAGMSHVVIRPEATEAAELAALQDGQADIAASDYGDIFYAQAHGGGLKILADGYDAGTGVLEVLTLPTSRITTPTDLAGLRVGAPSYDYLSKLAGSGDPVSLDTAAATEVLTSYLGNEATTVRWDEMSQAQEVTALRDHQLQAILVSEPYIYQAESELGAVEVLDACSGYTASLPLTGYVAMQSWVKQYPNAVADFQSALVKAQSDASVTGQVQQILPAATGMSKQDADLAAIGSYPTTTSANLLQRDIRLMTTFDMISLSQAKPMMSMIVKS